MKRKQDHHRGLVRTAAVGAVVLVAGVIPGTGTGAAVAEGQQNVDRELAYRCVLPAGERKATVRISAVLPRQVPAGRAVQAEQVSLHIRLSAETTADLAALGAAKAGGAARLTTAVTQGEESAEAPWAQLAVAETAIPPEGEYAIEARGAVPTVTARSGGELVFSAGPLGLDLLPRTADGEPTTPPELSTACTPEPEQETEFARVAVLPAPGGSERPEPPVVRDPADGDGGNGGQEGGGDTDAGTGAEPGGSPPRAPGRAGGAADDCVDEPPFEFEPKPSQAYIAGYSNVTKLGGAMFLREPGLMRVNMAKKLQTYTQCPRENGLQFSLYSDAVFDYRGKPQLPPAKATFLTFGFMPTTATTELTLDGPIEIVTDSFFKDGVFSEVTRAAGKVWVRLYDVKVNGTPLDVGPDCRTARPMELNLTGRSGEYTVEKGGPLTGTSTIPEFSGCGTTEDLDPLFTAALSNGPGNWTKMTQGAICTPASPDTSTCPAPVPVPER